MTNASRVNRKMERFLGYNLGNLYRPDTGEILSDRERSDYLNKTSENIIDKDNCIVLGEFLYDFENKTETFFRYRSRGMDKLEKNNGKS